MDKSVLRRWQQCNHTNELTLTLCYHCYTIYREMPDRIVKRVSYDIKEPCDICCRWGYEYKIYNKYTK